MPYPPNRTEEKTSTQEKKSTKPLDAQVGGGHYKGFAIQPIEYVTLNNLGFCEGNVIKYVSRWKQKNGIEDLKKARHMLDMYIQLLEGE